MNRFSLIFIICIGVLPIKAQRWLQGAGSYGRDELNGLSISSSNSIFSTGIYAEQSSFDAFLLSPFGNGDIFISKQDLDGTYNWVKRAGGVGIDRGNSIVSVPNNKIVVAGTITQNAQFDALQAVIQGSQDGFICQLDENGEFTWLQTIAGTGWKNIRSISTDQLGNIFIVGEFSGEAIFGNTTFTSTINPETLEPSRDIFLAKLSSNGSFLWSKQGSADFDDQAFAVTCDNLSNCYVTGKFSDTLSFISNHPNTLYNAGFLMKVDAQGEEIWFKRISGGQLSLQGLAFKNGSLYLGGAFTGNLSIQGSPNSIITNSFSKKCFLARFNNSGGIDWTNSYGSDNAISINSIDVDVNNDIYVGGTFRCGLTGFRTPETTRLWETIGYRDIYVAKFSNLNGERLWAQHYAGQKEDVLNALKVISIDDVIMGGFTRNGLSIPIPDSYTLHSSNRPLNETVNTSSSCPNVITGINESFKHIATIPLGENDIFVSRPVALNRDLIDQFRNEENCFPKVMPDHFISRNVNPLYEQSSGIYSLGPDTIERCGVTNLRYPYSTVGYDGLKREFSFHWTGVNGSAEGPTAYVFPVSQTSWVYSEIVFADGCPSLTDSVFHIIDTNFPPMVTYTSPDISLYTINPNSAYHGFYIPQDTITLNISPQFANANGEWTSGSNDYDQTFLQNGYSLTLNNPLDTLTFSYQYIGGMCKRSRMARIYPFLDYAADAEGNFLDSLNIGMFLVDSIYPTNNWVAIGDTLVHCNYLNNSNESIELMVADSNLWFNGIDHHIFARIRWTKFTPGLSPQISPPLPLRTKYSTNVTNAQIQAGQVTFQAEILMPPNDEVFKTLSKTIYFKSITVPNDFTVECPFTELCLFDTITALPSYADSIVIYSSNFNSLVWQPNQPFSITETGNYVFQGINIDPIYGCRSINSFDFGITQKTIYPFDPIPQNGVICPGESVTLFAEEGIDRFWIGPVGDTLGNGMSIVVSEPGLYRYIQSDTSGCRRSSEFMEVELNTIPYLQAEKNVICPGESLEIGVISDPQTTIQWLPPLSGNQLIKIINNPGIYKAVSFYCGINDTVSIPITLSAPLATIYAPNGLSFCPSSGIPLVANTGNYEFTWLPNYENDFSITNFNAGLIILETLNPDGCFARDSVVAVHLDYPNPPIITQDNLVCVGDSVQLSVNQSLDVEWLDFSSGNVLESTTTISLIANEGLIVYCRTKENSLGCESALSSFSVLFKPQLNSPQILKDSLICFGETLTLEVAEDSSVNEYQWFGPNNTNFTGANWILDHTDFQMSGNYQLNLIPTSNYCPIDTLEFDISVQAKPNPTIIFPSNRICEGSSLTLSAESAPSSSLVWQKPNGDEFQTTVLNLINVNLSESGWYYLIENLNGCIAQDSLFLIVDELPESPLVTISGGNCLNDTLFLNFPNFQNGDSIKLEDQSGLNNNIIDNTFAFEITANNAGIYNANTLRNGCLSESSTFTINSPLTINSGINDQYNLCAGKQFQLNSVAEPADSIASINWISPQGIEYAGNGFEIAPINISHSGIYTMQIIDLNGCKNEFLFNLQVNSCDSLGIPNSFTPNADGKNDTWKWNIPSAKDLSVSIFNKWGSEVNSLSGIEINWNGNSHNDNLLPAGTYFYIVNYKVGLIKEELKGFVEIKY